MKFSKKLGVAILGVVAAVALGACTSTPENKPDDAARAARDAKANSVVPCGSKNESLECRNLAEKKRRDEDPTRISYVYEMSWTGEFIGYFVVKGKVSSNQSQMGPMDQVLEYGCRSCNGGYGNVVVEAPGDDGSYGPNEDGIFFFTTDGNKITWNGMYQQSDKPLNIKVPQLYG
jgi:hypothetical protein